MKISKFSLNNCHWKGNIYIYPSLSNHNHNNKMGYSSQDRKRRNEVMVKKPFNFKEKKNPQKKIGDFNKKEKENENNI